MKANTPAERLVNGIIKENPTFVLVLGMCPTLAVTTSAINGIGMGLTTTVVLAMSNLMISLLRKFIPDGVRMPAFIVVVASFVTIVQMLLQGFIPSLYSALGIYIPLIVVNCIILGRAEAYACKNGPVESFFDGLGMGLGFSLSLTVIGMCREFFGAGAIFGHTIIPEAYHISIIILAPGALFTLAMLSAIQNKLRLPCATNGDAPKSDLVCGGNCASCAGCVSMTNHAALAEKKAEEAEALKKAQEEEQKAKEELQKLKDAMTLKTGDTITVKGVTYRVTNAEAKTAEAYGVVNKSQKHIEVAATVKIKGNTCKVTAIADQAFAGMKKATKAVIGKNVSKIGKKAFNGDGKLKSITVKSRKLKTVGKLALKGINKKAVIRIPKSKKKAYRKLFKGKGQKKSVIVK